MANFNHLPVDLQYLVYSQTHRDDRSNMLQALGRHGLKQMFVSATSRLENHWLPSLPANFPKLTSITLFCCPKLFSRLIHHRRVHIAKAHELEISVAPQDYTSVMTLDALLSKRCLEIWGIQRLTLAAGNPLLESCVEIESLSLLGPVRGIPQHISCHLVSLIIRAFYGSDNCSIALPDMPKLQYLELQRVRAHTPDKQPAKGLPALQLLCLDNSVLNDMQPKDLIHHGRGWLNELRGRYVNLPEEDVCAWKDVMDDALAFRSVYLWLETDCTEVEITF